MDTLSELKNIGEENIEHAHLQLMLKGVKVLIGPETVKEAEREY